MGKGPITSHTTGGGKKAFTWLRFSFSYSILSSYCYPLTTFYVSFFIPPYNIFVHDNFDPYIWFYNAYYIISSLFLSLTRSSGYECSLLVSIVLGFLR